MSLDVLAMASLRRGLSEGAKIPDSRHEKLLRLYCMAAGMDRPAGLTYCTAGFDKLKNELARSGC